MIEFLHTSLTFEPPSRIVNVTSDFVGELDIDDLEFVNRRCPPPFSHSIQRRSHSTYACRTMDTSGVHLSPNARVSGNIRSEPLSSATSATRILAHGK